MYDLKFNEKLFRLFIGILVLEKKDEDGSENKSRKKILSFEVQEQDINIP